MEYKQTNGLQLLNNNISKSNIKMDAIYNKTYLMFTAENKYVRSKIFQNLLTKSFVIVDHCWQEHVV